MKKRFAAAVCLIATALSLSACGGSGQTETTAAGGAAESTTAAPAAGVPAGGKVVRVAAVDPQVALDPQQYTYSIVMKITDNVTESLITTMEDGSLEPNLLTALPEVSEDGMTYSFELLPDVKFHNGETLKASDVKYSFERLVKLTKMATLMENVEGYKELADGAAEEMSGIQVQDDLILPSSWLSHTRHSLPFFLPDTVRFILRQPARKQEIPGVCRYYTEPVLSRWTAIRAA